MGVEDIVGVVGASYNDSGSNMYDEIKKTYLREAFEMKRKYPGHYILRNSADKILNLKFIYLVGGIPSIERNLISTLHSEKINKWVIVSHPAVKQIVDLHCEVFAKEIKEKNKEYVFVEEGPSQDWSILNTHKRGALGENLMFMTGDIPNFYDYDNVASDPDFEKYDAVLDLNSREKINRYPFIKPGRGHFPRYYHLCIKDSRGRINRVKEPNVFFYKKSRIAGKLIEDMFKYRKESKGGLKKFVVERIKKENLFDIAKLIWDSEKLTLVKGLAYLPYFLAKKSIYKAQGKQITYPLKVFTITEESLSTLVSIIADAKIKCKVRHNDPGRLEDIDSMEDWALLNALAEAFPDSYPYYEQAKEFEKYAMPMLRKDFSMYENWPEYINNECLLMEMVEFYKKREFVLDIPQFTMHRVEKLYKLHKKFNKRAGKRKSKVRPIVSSI